MDDEVMGEDHEHRDDAQQLDAGIPLPPHLRFGNAPLPLVFWMPSFMMSSSALVLSREIIQCRNDYWGAVSEIEILS